MKRKYLFKHLNKYKCKLLREGSKHSIYYNVFNNKTTSIPRHADIEDRLVVKICKDLDILFVFSK